MARVVAAVLASLVLAACGGDGAGGGEALTLSKQNDGETVQLEAGRSFRVELEANITTPYRWHLSKVPDPAIVDLVSSAYEADPSSEELVGSGGTSIWTFEAKAPGTTTIGLAYVEIGKPVPKRADFSVTLDVAR